MGFSSSIRIVIAALALLLAAGSASMAQQVPPVGPSGPTGWCTDENGNNFRC
jgi:hypothetical protein